MQDERYAIANVAAESCGLTEIPANWVQNLQTGRLTIVPSSPDDCMCEWGCCFVWVSVTGKILTCVGDSLKTPLVGDIVKPPGEQPVDPMVVVKSLGLPGVPVAWQQRLDGGAEFGWGNENCPRCNFVWYSAGGDFMECACQSLPSPIKDQEGCVAVQGEGIHPQPQKLGEGRIK